MIAGNGRFPLLALETARGLGDEVVAIGIQEEASPEIEKLAARCYWISIGAAEPADRDSEGRKDHRSHHGRAGEACQHFLVDPTGLALVEAAGGAEAEEHRRV